jgi:hypothetical protein
MTFLTCDFFYAQKSAKFLFTGYKMSRFFYRLMGMNENGYRGGY